MILAAIALAHQDALPEATKVISKMIARYHDAKRIKGECDTTVTIGEKVVNIKSTIQIERPTKLYLRQDVPDQGSYVLTSDGLQFSYQKPLSTPRTDRNPGARLVEDIFKGMRLGEIYHAASESLAERSTPLDLLVSDLPDLQMMRDQWQSMNLTGQVDMNGEQVYRIVGKWRLNKVSPPSANFGIFITADGDLRKYVIDQLPGLVPLARGETEVRITRETTINVSIDAEIEPKLFTVLR